MDRKAISTIHLVFDTVLWAIKCCGLDLGSGWVCVNFETVRMTPIWTAISLTTNPLPWSLASFFFFYKCPCRPETYKTLHMAHLLTSFCCWDGDLGVRGTIDAEYFPGKFLIVSLAGEWALGFLDWTSTQTIAIHFGRTIVFGMRSIEGGSSCCQDDIDRYLCTTGPVELLSPRKNGKDCNLSGAF